MKKLTLVALFLIFSFTCALAHNGAISLYIDENINDCDADIGMFEVVDINLYYVRDQGPDLGGAYEFRLVCSSGSVSFNVPTWPATMMIVFGTLTEGISVAHSTCIGTSKDVTWLGKIPVFNTVEAGEFTVTVVENPDSAPYPGIFITLCPDPPLAKYAVLGGTFVFNGSCNPDVDSKSWGAIKSLYK